MRSQGAWKYVVPVVIGSVLVAVDIAGVIFKAEAAGVDAGTFVLAVPGAVIVVIGICLLGLTALRRAREVRTSVLEAMFPGAVVENVSDRVGQQLFRFRSLVRDRSLVANQRYLSRVDVSVVVAGDSIQGWVGSRHPQRAFLLPKSVIRSVSVAEAPATPVLTKPAMKVGLEFDGVVGDVFFMFGGRKTRFGWELMDASQTQEIARRVQEKLFQR